MLLDRGVDSFGYELSIPVAAPLSRDEEYSCHVTLDQDRPRSRVITLPME